EAVQPVASIGLRDPQGGRALRFQPGEGLVGVVAATRQPVTSPDVTQDPRFIDKAWAAAEGLVSCLILPLTHGDRTAGILALFTRTPYEFSEEQVDLLRAFAAQAAIALENARLYREIQQHAASLEARVEERTRELVAANRALEKASRHKSEFLANMSHELRTPLSSVIGFAEVLLDQGTGPLTEKQTRFLGHIHQAGKHLLQLISDILDLSKVEAGKLTIQLEALPVHHVLEEVLVIARGLAQQKAQTMEAEIEPGLPPLRADSVRLKQILFNLLSNAVKFTPEQGRITLGARRVNGARPLGISPSQPGPVFAQPNTTAGEWLELRVTDTGMGIAPEDLPRLFQEFVQLETTATKRQEGTGLGLALTKRLVELHGGQISAESRGPGCGACFVVRLPYLEPPPPKRILVVEDQAPVLEALCAALQTAGHAVEPAQTGTQALSALAAAPPDLLVLDIGLPDVDGWAILGQLRSAEATRVLPVLVLTGLDQVRADQALALGADEFLAKPVSPRVLLETAARLLARSAREKGTPG
ncbi:MAG: ATP-binding protein, partial [Candidatus Methylomirabilales bacterium]